jgi:hypothetical protein
MASDRIVSNEKRFYTHMKKTMTPEQIEANRRNARKSTGPKTDAGKAAAK